MHKKADFEKGKFEFSINRKDLQESHEELDQLASENINGKDLERISKKVKKRRKNGGL